jgi:hypothetical protein
VAWLVSRDRWLPLIPLFVLWANLHAGFAYGLAVVASSVFAAIVADRDRLWTRISGAALCAAATLLTPLGFRNWTEIAASMERSRANAITEWQPAYFSVLTAPFWAMAALLLVVVITRWKFADSPQKRVLIAAALVSLPLAIRALRNIPAFAMLMLPASSQLMFESRPEREPRVPLAAAWLAVVLASVAVVTAWRIPWARLRWDPMSPAAAKAIASCRGPLFNSYAGGGPIIWFVPSQPVFVDSRQDPFPISLVQAGKAADFTGDYKALFAEWHINCAALAPTSVLVGRLRDDGWRTKFADSQWAVLERVRP